jgi:hypothetical protein
MLNRVLLLSTFAVAPLARAQVEYRNLDGGRPVRIEDATPTERHALDLDLATLRFDFLGNTRSRIQFEPRMAYGLMPNTEISIRVPAFIREVGQIPRAGVSGVGIGAMRQLNIESLRWPALGIAVDAFLPVGPAAARPSYSAKALITKTSTWARLHLNGAFGTYSARIPPPVTTPCVTSAGFPCGEPVPYLPPIDGPCTVGFAGGFPAITLACSSRGSLADTRALSSATTVTHGHWLVGLAADKAFPLRSLLVVADVFAERFEGLQRPVDWTSELGLRRQALPWLVLDGAVGRHYQGTTLSTFVTFGTTITWPLFL